MYIQGCAVYKLSCFCGISTSCGHIFSLLTECQTMWSQLELHDQILSCWTFRYICKHFGYIMSIIKIEWNKISVIYYLETDLSSPWRRFGNRQVTLLPLHAHKWSATHGQRKSRAWDLIWRVYTVKRKLFTFHGRYSVDRLNLCWLDWLRQIDRIYASAVTRLVICIKSTVEGRFTAC